MAADRLTDEVLRRLLEAEAAMTPGEWGAHQAAGGPQRRTYVIQGKDGYECVARVFAIPGKETVRHANATGIVLARNHLRALVLEVQALRAGMVVAVRELETCGAELTARELRAKFGADEE